MKKNIDEMTAKLFTAVKTAYLRECSGLVRNNGKCQPVTVDMMAQLLNGRQVDKLQVAEGTDPNKVIDLMEGYSCGLASLPHIYKQVARLAGESCEKITVYQDALQPYGFDYEAAANKDNKKVVAVIKKYCKVDDLRPYIGVVYHDAERHNAVWTDANVMIVSKALYNPAAAGRCVDANGLELEGYRYPNYAAVVPDFSTCYRFNGADVVANCTESLVAAKSLKKANGNRDEYDIFNAGMVEGRPACFNVNFLPFFKLIESPMYILPDSHKIAGYLHHGDGFILMMPISKKAAEESHLDEKTVYLQDDTRIARRVETAAAVSGVNLAAYLTTAADAAAAEVEKVEETPADAAAADVEKVEEKAPAFVTVGNIAVPNITPIMPADPRPEVGEVGDRVKYKYSDYEGTITQSWYHDIYLNEWRCTVVLDDGKEIHPTIKNLTILTAAEPMEEAPAATVTDADVLAQAERIKAIYEDMKAEAVEGMKADDLPDTTPIYTAADVEKMIEEATADTYTAEEVAALVAAAVAEERARHTRRRFAPLLRPVLRRLGRVAAVVLPLLIVALFMGASTDAAPATDAETVAQVIDLPAVTVTAEAPNTFIEDEAPCLIEDKAPCLIEDKAPAPSPVKKLAAPSPVKNVADAAECSSQKTDTADTPAGEKTASPMNTASDPHGLTICEGTPWAYTMMNWA